MSRTQSASLMCCVLAATNIVVQVVRHPHDEKLMLAVYLALFCGWAVVFVADGEKTNEPR